MNKKLFIITITILTGVILLLSIITFKEVKNASIYKNEIKNFNKTKSNYENNITKLNNKINELQNEIKNIKNSPLPNIEKTCTFLETFEFAGYYNINQGTTSGTYIIIYHDLGKDGPFIEYLDKNKFNIELKVGESYEITFQKNVYYNEKSNEFKENKIITKIEHTNNKGMTQTHENCILN